MIDPSTLALGGLAQADIEGAAENQAQLTKDFDNFLTLLTTQLQFQDPLNPTDTSEFTNQLVSFSQLEQQILQSERIDNLVKTSQAATINAATSFIGKTVRYEGDTFNFSGADANTAVEFGYFLTENANDTRLSVLDTSGRVVRSIQGDTGSGEHTWVWDGLDNNGQPVGPGTYLFQVGAVGEGDRAVQTSGLVPSTITGMEISNGTVSLTAGNVAIGLDSILSVRQ